MNAYERIVAANLEPAVPDGRACLEVFKQRHPETWGAVMECMQPRAAAGAVLDVVLRPNRHLAP